MKLMKHEKGQFVIIAVMMIAIMIVAIAVTMYSTQTYFEQKRWEEYMAVIDDIEISSKHVLEISLANYTSTAWGYEPGTSLKDNVNQWKINLREVQTAFGINLQNAQLTNGSYSAYGVNINYTLGLSRHWYDVVTFSAANTSFTVDLLSLGLTGYKFVSSAFLKMTLLDFWYDGAKGEWVVPLTIQKEGLLPVTNLVKDNFMDFLVDENETNFRLARNYNGTLGQFVYELRYTSASGPTVAQVTVVDNRGIKVVGGRGTYMTSLCWRGDLADARVEYTSPNSNYGEEAKFHVRTTSNGVRRTYLKYDLRSLPPRARITSALLILYAVADDGQGTYEPINMHAVTDNWDENTVTWNNGPPLGPVVATTLVGPKNQYYSWDITAYAQEEFEGDKIASMIARFAFDNPQNPAGQPSRHRDFGSKESREQYRPCLEITYSLGPPPPPPQPPLPPGPITPATIGYRSKTGTDQLKSPKTRTWNGTAWSLENALPNADSNVRFVRVAYSPLPQRYYEKIIVTLSDDQYLDAYVWNGTSWQVTNNINTKKVGNNAVDYRSFDVEYEKTSGRAILFYSRDDNNETGYRIWNGTSWSQEYTYDLVSGKVQVYWIKLAQNPRNGSNELALICLDQNKDAHALIWNGDSWGNHQLLENNVPTNSEECIAVSYETVSGNAMFIWGKGGQVESRRWTGSSWENELSPQVLGGNVYWLSMKSSPLSNKIIYVAINDGKKLFTVYWNGTLWEAPVQHDDNVDTRDQRCADVEWEAGEENILLVWGTQNGKLSYRGLEVDEEWTTIRTIDMPGTHLWVQLRRNTGTDQAIILGVVLDSNKDLGFIMWNGFTLTGAAGVFATDTTVTTYECFELEFQKFANP